MDVLGTQLWVTWKSKEKAPVPVMKGWEVVTYHRNPLRRLASLMGRCITVLWKMTVEVPTPGEMAAMPEMLHFVRKVREQALREGGKWKWAEFDLVEMFPNIQREDILKSLE